MHEKNVINISSSTYKACFNVASLFLAYSLKGFKHEHWISIYIISTFSPAFPPGPTSQVYEHFFNYYCHVCV